MTEQFDPAELLRYAEMYGHPEEWIKKAQQLHAENERLRATVANEVQGRPACADAHGGHASAEGSSPSPEPPSLSCPACGHPQADRYGSLLDRLRLLVEQHDRMNASSRKDRQ